MPRSPFRRTMLAAGLVAVAPFAAHGQSTFAYGYAYQYADLPNQYQNVVPPGCFGSAATSGAAAAGFGSCTIGGMVASATSTFDPTTGTLKSGAFLSATGQTLSQFIPQYDPITGDRIYTGAARPDAVGVYTFVAITDYFQLNAAPGVMPATISFFLDIDGTLAAPTQASGATAYAGNFLNFCTGALGACGAAPDQVYYGGSYQSLSTSTGAGFLQQSFAPAGQTPAGVTFSGSQSATSVNGRLTIDNLPIVVGSPFDFVFAFGTDVAFYHPTANIGNIPVGCDPALDPTCPAVDPTDVVGDAVADFTHTLHFAGYQVLDAAGNDVTASTRLTFASGLQPSVTTPEPATVALLGGGLLALGAVRVRRRARA